MAHEETFFTPTVTPDFLHREFLFEINDNIPTDLYVGLGRTYIFHFSDDTAFIFFDFM